jgi:selenocysteine lyase/cysteine desulfurase
MQNEFAAARNVCYLNTATEGILPLSAAKAIETAVKRKQSPHLIDDADFFELPRRCRSLIGGLLNCSAEEIALTGSTGYSIGVVALSLPLQKGDEVLLVERDFPSNNFSWEPLLAKGIQIRKIPFDPESDQTARLLDSIQSETRVVSINSVHHLTGYRYDLQAISQRCQDAGIYLVIDATQMIGALELDLKKTRVHALAAAGYKWQLSFDGTGFLYINQEVMPQLQPTLSSWLRNADANSFAEIKMFDSIPARSASRFEMTAPIALWSAYEKCLQILKECRIPWIESHNVKLVQRCKEFFKEAGWKIHDNKTLSSILAAVPPARYSPSSIVARLAEQEVYIAVRQNCLRISPHFYNSEQDIDRFAEELRKLL